MNARGQTGSSLVELMIAITVGLVITAGNLTLFQSTLQSNRNLATGKLLEGELHTTLDLMTRDLRRIGAMGNPLRQVVGIANPFGIDTPSAFSGEPADSCMTYSYDLNGNGALDTSSAVVDERLGFRLRAGAVQMRGSGLACSASSGWTTVTTTALVQVTTLHFAVVNTTNLGVTERLVTVTIAGRLVSDSTVARAISRTVRLRNDV